MNCPNCLSVVLGFLGHLKALPVVGLSVFVLLSYISIYNYINTTNKHYYNGKYKDTRTIPCNSWYIKDSTVLTEKDSHRTNKNEGKKTGDYATNHSNVVFLPSGEYSN